MWRAHVMAIIDDHLATMMIPDDEGDHEGQLPASYNKHH